MLLNVETLYDRKIKEERDNWHTFHIIIFQVFSILVKINLTADIASNIVGL
jgi:hypothetical protein